MYTVDHVDCDKHASQGVHSWILGIVITYSVERSIIT